MARLYDPTRGKVLLHGRDLESYAADERALKVAWFLAESVFVGRHLEGQLTLRTPQLQR